MRPALKSFASDPNLVAGRGRGRPAPIPIATRGHRRKDSSASNASNQSAPTPYMERLMAQIATSPKGSKMAEDTAKALLIAEQARFRETGVPLARPAPKVPPRQSSKRVDNPYSPQSSPSEAGSSIGRMMLSPTLEQEDPFEYTQNMGSEGDVDELTNLYAELGPYQSPSLSQGYPEDAVGSGSDRGNLFEEPSYPSMPGMRPGAEDALINGNAVGNVASSLLRNRSQMVRPKHNAFSQVHPDQNALAIFWRGTVPGRFALISISDAGTEDVFPLEVSAKHTQVLEMPPQWLGRVQRVTGHVSEPATECEVQFGGYRGLNFFGVSYAHGNNGPVVMRSDPSGEQAGSPFLAAQVAPASITQRDSGGVNVVVGTEGVTNQRRLAVCKFYRDFFDHAEQGAIMTGDESATVATRDRHLLLDFY